jgi:hypothetical protein
MQRKPAQLRAKRSLKRKWKESGNKNTGRRTSKDQYGKSSNAKDKNSLRDGRENEWQHRLKTSAGDLFWRFQFLFGLSINCTGLSLPIKTSRKTCKTSADYPQRWRSAIFTHYASGN